MPNRREAEKGVGAGVGEATKHHLPIIPLFWPALQRLRGSEDVAAELEELQEERMACHSLRARRPWELFADPSLRRQVLSLVVLSSSMALCGNDTVRRPVHTFLCRGSGGGPLAFLRYRALCLAAPLTPPPPGVCLCLLCVPGGGHP